MRTPNWVVKTALEYPETHVEESLAMDVIDLRRRLARALQSARSAAQKDADEANSRTRTSPYYARMMEVSFMGEERRELKDRRKK